MARLTNLASSSSLVASFVVHCVNKTSRTFNVPCTHLESHLSRTSMSLQEAGVVDLSAYRSIAGVLYFPSYIKPVPARWRNSLLDGTYQHFDLQQLSGPCANTVILSSFLPTTLYRNGGTCYIELPLTPSAPRRLRNLGGCWQITQCFVLTPL